MVLATRGGAQRTTPGLTKSFQGGFALPVNICACSSWEAVEWQSWKSQLICLSAGWAGCRMTSAYHCSAAHFLALEGRSACCRSCTGTSWAGVEPSRGPNGLAKGSNPGLEGARKGEVVSSTAQMLQELADLGRTLCIQGVFAAVDIIDGADQPSTTPSGKLTVC